MRVFVGFGYNERDNWVKVQVFPILECMGFVVVTGEDMHGDLLQPEVKRRIEQCDAVVGFLTIRNAEDNGEFNSHLWVQNELVYESQKTNRSCRSKKRTLKFPMRCWEISNTFY